MQVALWSASIVGAKHKQWPGCGGTPANGKGAGNNLHFICTWTIQTRNRNIEQAQVNGYLAAVMNDMI
jgi:hypothetical protein